MPGQFGTDLSKKAAVFRTPLAFDLAGDGALLGVLTVGPDVLGGDDGDLLNDEMLPAKRVHQRTLDEPRLMGVDEAIDLHDELGHRGAA